MRLLDRYIARECLKILLLCLVVFMGVYLIVDLFEKFSRFLASRGKTFDDGIDWRWGERFEAWVEALGRGLAINMAPLVGHSSIRLYVMGEDAARTTTASARWQGPPRQRIETGHVKFVPSEPRAL